MSAVEDLLHQVEAAGGRLIPRGGDRLRVEAPKPLPDDLMAALRAHKGELLKLVRPAPPPAPNRAAADQHAVARWLANHPPEHVDPEHCPACGSLLKGEDLPLAVRARGAKPGDWRGHVWVCDSGRCVEDYYQKRRAEAEAALYSINQPIIDQGA